MQSNSIIVGKDEIISIDEKHNYNHSLSNNNDKKLYDTSNNTLCLTKYNEQNSDINIGNSCNNQSSNDLANSSTKYSDDNNRNGNSKLKGIPSVFHIFCTAKKSTILQILSDQGKTCSAHNITKEGALLWKKLTEKEKKSFKNKYQTIKHSKQLNNSNSNNIEYINHDNNSTDINNNNYNGTEEENNSSSYTTKRGPGRRRKHSREEVKNSSSELLISNKKPNNNTGVVLERIQLEQLQIVKNKLKIVSEQLNTVKGMLTSKKISEAEAEAYFDNITNSTDNCSTINHNTSSIEEQTSSIPPLISHQTYD